MQERLVVRGQIVAIECSAGRSGQKERGGDVVRWYHDGELVRVHRDMAIDTFFVRIFALWTLFRHWVNQEERYLRQRFSY
jgi:hypothetical protein